MNQSIKRPLALLISALTISACSTSKEAMIPLPSQNMRQVYDSHMGSVSANRVRETRAALTRPLEQDEVDLAHYSRTESNHLSNQFSFLPNPLMVMYVAPHLSTSNGVPIPGYITQFRMYDKDHYALPHEMVNYSNKPLPLKEGQ